MELIPRRNFLKTLLAGLPAFALDWDSFPRKTRKEAQEGYDAVIIGAGLGGLSCAAAFARQGYDPWKKYEADYFKGNKDAYRAEKERMADILIQQVEKTLMPGGGYGACLPSGLQCFGEIMKAWQAG